LRRERTLHEGRTGRKQKKRASFAQDTDGVKVGSKSITKSVRDEEGQYNKEG